MHNDVKPSTNISEIGQRLAATLTALRDQVNDLTPLVQGQARGKIKFNASNSKTNRSLTRLTCTVCGRQRHTRASCQFLNSGGSSWHPNANLTTGPWKQSIYGLQFAKQGIPLLPFTIDVGGNRIVPPSHISVKITPKQKN